ncbi:reverse transcriptase domain protein [Metarhizium robertsii]|uniref:Reverse transcriptase domain protein n=1 Tax=Metarhizium robertsii TaxID=568076 RepID=A0A014PIP6_9HYPO|nr:reverse transcriptase domain protein [Metarhizium robertsii]
MATATSSPPYEPDPLDLVIYTPKNLARGARAALLRDSSPVEITDIGVSPQLDEFPALPTTVTHEQRSPIDITDAANQLVDEQVAAYNAKLRVFRTFCAHFNEAAKEFTTGPERDFAKHFSSSFLEFWKQALTNTNCAPAPTYSSITANANASPTRIATTNMPTTHHKKPAATYRQGRRPPVPAPPREDLRVFVRLEADAPARNHIGYAIRAHVASKTGLELNRIPQVFQVNTGWAIRAADDEINNQTGLTPVSIRVPRRDNEQLPYKTLIISFLEPTTRPWSLFGTSRLARHIERSNPPKQYENCWDYHTRHTCNRQTRCKRCGKTNHASDSCTAPEQCANCLGLHAVDLAACPARPKRAHGLLHRLPKEQRVLIRQMGSRLFQQHQAAQQRQQSQMEPSGQPAAEAVAEQQRAPVAVMELRQEHVNPQALTNFFTCTLPVLPSSSPMRPRAVELGPETAPRQAKNSRCLTKTAYDTVDSRDTNDTRPRVMTYIHKDSRILADQKRPTVTRDILWPTVNGVTIVNFYRQPHYDVALDVLLRWSAPERTLVAGDFNAKHYSWQTGRLEGRGEDIATWAAENGLNLLNTADVPTNPHGNTIDLAFSNIALASAVVEDHLATSSDHFTLSVILPDVSLNLPQVPGKVRVTTEEELERFKELVNAGAYRVPTDVATASQLDSLAAALVDLLQSAARAAGRPVRKGTRSAPWWTDECAEAAAEYRAIRRILPLGFSQEVQLARREFQRVVRRAKRQYWRNLIDGFSDSASVYKAVRWLKSPGTFQPPPLQIGDDVYETQLDKANALRRSTLERRTAADDITDPWIPVRPARKIPFAQVVTLEEAEDATIKTGNTSPRANNITVKLLQTAGKRNLSTPRAWRPISLLSCLGKGLERLIARRLAWATPKDGSASEYLQALVNWGAANGISFDPEKTEVMHFSPRRRKTEPPVRHGDVEKQPEAAMRWLGLCLNRKLTFKTHVEKWTAKAQTVAHHLRSLGNTRRGALPSAVQRAVRACVEPILLFGVEAWYPGTTSPRWRRPSKEGPSRIQQLVRKMSKALKQAIRAILPIWKTTPIAVLHRESGIPPVHQLLEARRLRFSARIKSLDHAHPLAKRSTEIAPRPIIKCIKLKYQLPPKAFPTRLRRTNKLLANCQRPVLVPRKYRSETPQPLQTASKEDSAKHFLDWLQSIPPSTLIVYSDGSLSPTGAAGYGFTVHQNGHSIRHGAGRLGPAEVFDAEAKGALEGLKAALNLPQSVTQKIVVCLDNIAAAKCLRGRPSDSSQRVFLTFQALAKTHRKTEVRWIPGHTKIPGNEQADILAKTGCAQPEPADAVPTLAFLRKTARQRSKIAVQAWWDASAPDKYQGLTLKFPSSCPPELALPRSILHHLLAARTHHGDFADYHERFRHDDACIKCSCGRRKAPTHLFYCRKIQPRCRMRLAPSPTVAINQAIGKDFDKFVKLVKASSFFEKICPHH